MTFRHFPGSGLFWSFFSTVRGDNNAEPAQNLYFCLIFYALLNAINRILLHRLLGVVGRVERSFATPCITDCDGEKFNQLPTAKLIQHLGNWSKDGVGWSLEDIGEVHFKKFKDGKSFQVTCQCEGTGDYCFLEVSHNHRYYCCYLSLYEH
jgi:hypothetical protein